MVIAFLLCRGFTSRRSHPAPRVQHRFGHRVQKSKATQPLPTTCQGTHGLGISGYLWVGTSKFGDGPMYLPLTGMLVLVKRNTRRVEATVASVHPLGSAPSCCIVGDQITLEGLQPERWWAAENVRQRD